MSKVKIVIEEREDGFLVSVEGESVMIGTVLTEVLASVSADIKREEVTDEAFADKWADAVKRAILRDLKERRNRYVN